MLKSMTGFGTAEQLIAVGTEGGSFEIKVNIKSVNSRYSDFFIKIPGRHYAFLEERVRSFMTKYISRGKVEVFITIDQKEEDTKEVIINKQLAQSYITAFASLEELGVVNDVRASTLTRFSDIFKTEYAKIDEDAMFSMVSTVLGEACENFNTMRQSEGERMLTDIESRLANILAELVFVEERSPQTAREYADKLRERLNQTLEAVGITADEGRILTEVAIFSDKTAVAEETVRLRSHISEFEKTLQSSNPIGKKLDFIVQEMNREVNTIGSKANDLEISKRVVEMKSEIEKIREQIQNIE
ncbi:MAG: YicC family protein [Oscillospiraceae bacterium]|nr:YicC family protein [Oscillospiraceae bacterium]